MKLKDIAAIEDGELLALHGEIHELAQDSPSEARQMHDLVEAQMIGRKMAHTTPLHCEMHGLYLVPPHGEMIADGRKKAIAKSRDWDLADDWILVSGKKAYGEITLGQSEEVSIEEFDARYDEHKVSKEERLRWWPKYDTLFLFYVKQMRPYPEPRRVEVPPGVQTVMREIEFKERADDVVRKLDGLPERFVWIPDFVSLTGSQIYAKDREPRDVDVILRAESEDDGFSIRLPLDASFALKLERLLKDALKAKKVQYTASTFGPNWDHAALYDLCLVRKPELKVTSIAEREPEFAEMEYKELEEDDKGIRQLFGSPGGKSRLAKTIVALIPEHKTYVEPFAGAAAVLFAKDLSEIEVLGDLDERIIFVFRTIKNLSDDETGKLRKKDWCNNREKFYRLRTKEPKEKIDRLYQLLYLSKWGYRGLDSGTATQKWSHGHTRDIGKESRVVDLIEKAKGRLRNVKIVKADYKATVKKYDSETTFFFLDPPYPGEWSGGTDFSIDDFAKFLKTLKAKWLVTLNDTPKHRKAFSGWNVRTVDYPRFMGQTSNTMLKPGVDHELLIANYPLPTRIRRKARTLTKSALDRLLRGASANTKRQAKRSFDENKIMPGRAFVPLKPLRTAPEGERQVVSNFYDFIDENLDFPLYLSAKRDGYRATIHRKNGKVVIFSDDGKDTTETLPHLVKRFEKFGKGDWIVDAELELWKGGQHYPREAASGVVHSGEGDEDIAANIFRILYWDGEDLHDEPFSDVWAVMQKLPVDTKSDGKLYPRKDGPVNLVPHYKVGSLDELKKRLLSTAYKPGVEGVVVKRADGTYPLDGKPGKPPTSVKWHKSFEAVAEVTGKTETKTKGVFVYNYSLGGVEAGKTFGSATKLNVGDCFVIEGEQLNLEKDDAGKTVKVSIWVPELIEPTSAKAEALDTIISRARRQGVLQEKIRHEDGSVEYLPTHEGEPETADKAADSKAKLEDYPDENLKLEYVAHEHFRGKSAHLDPRFEYKRGDSHYLRGWTVMNQQPGAIKEPVTTMAAAKQAVRNPRNWKMDMKTGLIKPREIRGGVTRRGSLRATRKAAEVPKDWMYVEGVTEKPEPGEPIPAGATREYPGVFLIVSKGPVSYGAIKPWLQEYFLNGTWKGRWLFRLIERKGEKYYAVESDDEAKDLAQRLGFKSLDDFRTLPVYFKEEVLPPGVEEERPREAVYWLLMQPKDQTPYVLDKDAIKKNWLPPKHVSCLPPKLRKSVPKNLRYWEMDRAKALEARKELAGFEELGGTELKKQVGEWRPYCLQRHWWRGQVVIRFGPSTEHYDLRVKQDGKQWHLVLDGNPLEKQPLAAYEETKAIESVETTDGKRVNVFDVTKVELKPSQPANPTKDTPAFLETIDKGQCRIIGDKPEFRKLEFKGGKLKGAWVFKREEPSSDLGEFMKSAGPETKAGKGWVTIRGKPVFIGRRPSRPLSKSVKIVKAPEKLYAHYGLSKPTDEEKAEFLASLDTLPPEVQAMWKEDSKGPILAVGPDRFTAYYHGGWVVVPKGTPGGEVAKHEFTHHIVNQPYIAGKLGAYKPHELFTHEQWSRGKKGSEDLSMMLSLYDTKPKKWAENLVQSGETVGKNKKIDSDIAHGKVTAANNFLSLVGAK